MPTECVITGIGCVSAVGVGIGPTWEALCSGSSGLRAISAFDASAFPCSVGGEVFEGDTLLSARDYVPKSYRKATKVMARDTQLAVAAAALAVRDAGLVTRESQQDPAEFTYAPEELGRHIGADEIASAFVTAKDDAGRFSLREWGEHGIGNLQPLWMLKYLPNMLACHVTIIHGAEGPSNTITCSEASGLMSVGESRRIIERGAAKACLSGGIESKVNAMGISRMGLCNRFAEIDSGDPEPWRAIRPYDVEAPGGVPGEGGGIIVLEDAAHANKRGARVYAELAGFGSAHAQMRTLGIATEFDCGMGAPVEEDEGLTDAIQVALRDAGISPDQVDAIIPAASGVRPMDTAELGALERVFGDRLSEIPLAVLTPYVGQLFAGAGAIGLTVGAMMISEQRLPARIHAGRPDGRVLAGASESVGADLRYVVVCTGSLAGQAAAAVLRRPDLE